VAAGAIAGKPTKRIALRESMRKRRSDAAFFLRPVAGMQQMLVAVCRAEFCQLPFLPVATDTRRQLH
jgi:hypothetical protein